MKWSIDFLFLFLMLILRRLNFQVVLGGPFLPHIECILRNKASSMHSPVISAYDTGNQSKIKGISIHNGRPCQSCDIVIQVESEINLVWICRLQF